MIEHHDHPLYRSILENRLDDLPRLVFADWLEEQGHFDRANLIRSQCVYADQAADPIERLHAKLTQNQLLESFVALWRAQELPPATDADWGLHHRGFIDTLTVSPDAILHPSILPYLAQWPVSCLDLRHIAVDSWASLTRDLRDALDYCPALILSPRHFTQGTLADLAHALRDQLRSLTLAFNRPGLIRGDELAEFRQLRSLSVSLTNFSDRRIAPLLQADLPLSQFSAAGCRLTAEILPQLFGSPCLSRLTELNLGNNDFRQSESVPFAAQSAANSVAQASQLAVLNLRSCRLDAPSLAPWLTSPVMQGLRVLTLDCNPLGPSGFHAICEQLAGGALHTLKINECSLADPNLAILRQTPLARTIRSLSIMENDLRNGQFVFLEDWLAHGRLQILHADRNPLGQRDFEVIFPATQSPLPWVELSLSDCGLNAKLLEGFRRVHSAPHLLGLNLANNRLQDRGLRHLLDSPLLDHVRYLQLSHTGITEASLQAILDCDRLPKTLAHLTLHGIVKDSDERDIWLNRLRDRFGPNVYL